MTYLDTSALIKRFVAEKGSPLIQSMVAERVSVATAKIAYAELYAGLRRRRSDIPFGDSMPFTSPQL